MSLRATASVFSGLRLSRAAADDDDDDGGEPKVFMLPQLSGGAVKEGVAGVGGGAAGAALAVAVALGVVGSSGSSETSSSSQESATSSFALLLLLGLFLWRVRLESLELTSSLLDAMAEGGVGLRKRRGLREAVRGEIGNGCLSQFYFPQDYESKQVTLINST